ncbi:hypothetical protein AB1Y20_016125 [Prymnesium parvum]|uniref:Uncharacterized protein n=1 Tax=Prymnesium parvum TaxID=97485 RepID=A0AB34JZV9_PRYPA
MWLFGGKSPQKSSEDEEASKHEASISDIDMWTAHTIQLNEHLQRVQELQEEEHAQMARTHEQERAQLLQLVRRTRLDAALTGVIGCRESRHLSSVLRQWSRAVSLLREGKADDDLQRLPLHATARSETLRERELLLRQASDAAMEVERLRSALSKCSHELERAMLKDTQTFELWTDDSMQTKQMIQKMEREHAERLKAAAAREQELMEKLRQAQGAPAEADARRSRDAGGSVAAELTSAKEELRVHAARQMLTVRFALQQTSLHRVWRVWAVAASLLLREARAALLSLELERQQERNTHTRLQAIQEAEVAQLRVENLEARLELQKAAIFEQANLPQRHAQNNVHRIAQAESEVLLKGLFTKESSKPSKEQEEAARALTELEDRLMYERGTSSFHAGEQARSAAALQRAGCEMRVLIQTISSIEDEIILAGSSGYAPRTIESRSPGRGLAARGSKGPAPVATPNTRPRSATPSRSQSSLQRKSGSIGRGRH